MRRKTEMKKHILQLNVRRVTVVVMLLLCAVIFLTQCSKEDAPEATIVASETITPSITTDTTTTAPDSTPLFTEITPSSEASKTPLPTETPEPTSGTMNDLEKQTGDANWITMPDNENMSYAMDIEMPDGRTINVIKYKGEVVVASPIFFIGGEVLVRERTPNDTDGEETLSFSSEFQLTQEQMARIAEMDANIKVIHTNVDGTDIWQVQFTRPATPEEIEAGLTDVDSEGDPSNTVSKIIASFVDASGQEIIVEGGLDQEEFQRAVDELLEAVGEEAEESGIEGERLTYEEALIKFDNEIFLEALTKLTDKNNPIFYPYTDTESGELKRDLIL